MKFPKAAVLEYHDIEVGAVYHFHKKIHKEQVMKFADLTGDYNPLHTDPVFGEKSLFHKNIVHGMLIGSLFSTLVGMYCPGEKCLYVSQSLKFKEPVFYDDNVMVKGTVKSKNDSVQLITIKTEIVKDNVVAISGNAIVRVL